MATEAEVETVLGLLCAAYPNFELQDATTELWKQAFRTMPVEHLEAAATAHLLSSRYFPAVGEAMPHAETLWNRATEAERSKKIQLEERVPDRNDPKTIEGREKLRELMRGIGKSMPAAKPEDPEEPTE